MSMQPHLQEKTLLACMQSFSQEKTLLASRSHLRRGTESISYVSWSCGAKRGVAGPGGG